MASEEGRTWRDCARPFRTSRKAHPRTRGAVSSAFATSRCVQKVWKTRGTHARGTWRRKEAREGTVALTDGVSQASGCRKSSWKRGSGAMVLRADVALSRETHALGAAEERVERRAGAEEVRGCEGGSNRRRAQGSGRNADVKCPACSMQLAREDARADGSEETGPRPAVRQVLRNLFAHRKRKVVDEDDIMVCTCERVHGETGAGCGEDCINRLMCIECTPGYCPCGERCSNQMFTRRQYAKIGKFRCGKKGFGLQALENIAQGQFIIEYCGEVLDEGEYMYRKTEYACQGERHHYFMSLAGGEVIDARRKGNLGRFINHSCDPNCETQKWMVQGELCIGFFALKDIQQHEEITFDYNFERYGEKPTRCLCGTEKCRGFIGGGDILNEDSLSDEEYEEDLEPVFLDARDDGDGVDPDRPLKGSKKALKDGTPTSVQRTRSSAKAREASEPTPPTRHVKLSEVQRRLAPLLGRNGGLAGADDALPMLRLFKLAMAGEVVGVKSTWNIRELSLILDATEKTSTSAARQALVRSGILNQLHMILAHLVEDGSASAILRKALRIIEPLPIDSRKLETVRSGHEKLPGTLLKLRTHQDSVVREKASSLVAKFSIEDSISQRLDTSRNGNSRGSSYWDKSGANDRSSTPYRVDGRRSSDVRLSAQKTRAPTPETAPGDGDGHRFYGNGNKRDGLDARTNKDSEQGYRHSVLSMSNNGNGVEKKVEQGSRWGGNNDPPVGSIRNTLHGVDSYKNAPCFVPSSQKRTRADSLEQEVVEKEKTVPPALRTRDTSASQGGGSRSQVVSEHAHGVLASSTNPVLPMPDSWEKPDRTFEKAVHAIVRRRLMKYVEVQDHPLHVSLEEASVLHSKMCEYTLTKERSFWEEKKRKGKAITIRREKVEQRVKEFVRARLRKEKGLL